MIERTGPGWTVWNALCDGRNLYGNLVQQQRVAQAANEQDSARRWAVFQVVDALPEPLIRPPELR